MIVGNVDWCGFFTIGVERFERLCEQLAETAADIACPANFDHTSASVECNAGLVRMYASDVSEAVFVDIVQQRAHCGLHLFRAGACSHQDRPMYVNFDSHRCTPFVSAPNRAILRIDAPPVRACAPNRGMPEYGADCSSSRRKALLVPKPYAQIVTPCADETE